MNFKMILRKIINHIKKHPIEYMAGGFIASIFASEIIGIEMWNKQHTLQKQGYEICYDIKTGEKINLNYGSYEILRKQIADQRGHLGRFKFDGQEIEFRYIKE